MEVHTEPLYMAHLIHGPSEGPASLVENCLVLSIGEVVGNGPLDPKRTFSSGELGCP